MFWYMIGFCAAIAALLVLWANAGAFGMEEDDTPQSTYEKQLGLGATLRDQATVAHEREATRLSSDDDV